MSFLSADEIAVFQVEAEQLLTDTAQLQEPNWVADNMGGRKRDPLTPWTTVATVPCNVAPDRDGPQQEQVVADRVTPVMFWIIKLPASTNVAEQQRIAIGSHTFEVMAVLGPRTLELLRRVRCVKVE